MSKLANTVKGVLKRLKAKKAKTKKIILTFENIHFSDEYFNSTSQDGELKKVLLPIEWAQTIKNKTTKKAKTYTHFEAMAIWRVYVAGSHIPLQDSDDEDSDDEMQQLAARTAGINLTS